MTVQPPLGSASKAETLERLAPILRAARVLPQVRFTTAEWDADPDVILARLRRCGWLARPVIVRSSALVEDSTEASLAGRFESIAQRLGTTAVRAAIDKVAAGMSAVDGDQVFVQPQLERVSMSGVVLTRDPSNGGHYTIVSYDVTSGTTDTITSGRAEDRLTYYYHADASTPPAAELQAVLALADELGRLLDADALDIEFALTDDGALYLLQVRPLRIEGAILGRAGEARALARVAARIAASSGPHPYLYGTRAVFGTMPDWNPAEIIGARPNPLALSLYRELITDSIWAYQRSNYGYRNLRSFPLLLSLGGLPYIDVRVSFNSFLPADLDADLGRRLVDDYTERLLASPLDHDKIEFAIVYSCYTLDLDERMRGLRERGFSKLDCERFTGSLRTLTNRITADTGALFRIDIDKIAELERRQAAFEGDALRLDVVSRIYWLLEDCKRYGTLPFAGIARAAFIAVQLLDSLVVIGVISAEERGCFLRSLRTIRAAMDGDLAGMTRGDFLCKYGHLRPGTYDITSNRYDESPAAYFQWKTAAPAPEADAPAAFEISDRRRQRLDALLVEHGLAHDTASLFGFFRAAIEGREYAKFVFSRSLSAALVLFGELGAECGFSRDDLACADVEVIRRLYAGSDDPRTVLEESIEAGKRRFAVTRQLTLPPLVTEPADVFAFHLPVCEPNYVTMGSASGPVVLADAPGPELRGAVVMIPSADPGYDWIFSHSIAAFITTYGGYNSHMAIRANELGIPAVIGAGEPLYRSWAAAARLRIDCQNRRVEVLG